MKDQLTDSDVRDLKRRVLLRDKRKCILCGRQTRTVHEIEPRSHSFKNSSRIFRLENMCCLCHECHMRLHFSSESSIRKEMTANILRIMAERYHYS